MLKKLLVGICIVIGALISTGNHSKAEARVSSPTPGVILLENNITLDDYMQFVAATSYRNVKHYDVVIHTPGGNAHTVVGIMNRMKDLQNHGVKFRTIIQGMGTSGGTYIFLMGDERVVYEGATLMLHGVIAQMQPSRIMYLKSTKPSEYSMVVSIDNFFKKRVQELTGCSEALAEHWINGGQAQFFSALTAYNTNIANVYVNPYATN